MTAFPREFQGVLDMARGWLLGPILALGAGTPAVSVAAEEPVEVILLHHCAIEYERKSLLGSASPGIIQDCLVRPGDRVKAGQVLGRLLNQDLLAEVDERSAEAASEVSIKLSEAQLGTAIGKLARAEKLRRQNFVSLEDYNLLKLDVEAARAGLEEAKHKRRLAHFQLRKAQGLARAREFVSPYDGIVVEILKRPGESVSYTDPVFQVVDVDHLRITGHLDVGDAWRVRVGHRVRVRPQIPGAQLPIESEQFHGRIVFVDRQFSSETQTCKVFAEVENRDELLRGGLSGSMEIVLGDVPERAPGTPPNGKGPGSGPAPESTGGEGLGLAPGRHEKPPKAEAGAPPRTGRR